MATGNGRAGTVGALPHLLVLLLCVVCLQLVSEAARTPLKKTKQQASIPHDALTKHQEWNEVCRFYSQSAEQMEVEMRGPGNAECAGIKWQAWWQRASSLCISCFNKTNVCKNPPVLVFHAYLDGLHKRDWRASLAFLKAFLLSQDLRKTRLLLWVTNDEEVLYHPQAAEFFRAFDRVVEVHTMWWIELVWETPIQVHGLFANDTLLQRVQPHSPMVDMLRILALYKHGGIWLDSDIILLKDIYPLVAKVGYQFSARWPTGNHLLSMKQHSPVAWQMMELLGKLPEEADDILQKLEELCRPQGFIPTPGLERSIPNYMHGCLMPMAVQNAHSAAVAVGNATGPLHQLHQLPLAWFDPSQHKCVNVRADMNDSTYQAAMQRYVAVQSRYPAVPHSAYPIGSRSLLGRAMDLAEEFFENCEDWSCLYLRPVDHVSLIGQRVEANGKREL